MFSLDHFTVCVFQFWPLIQFLLENIFFKRALALPWEGWAFLTSESEGSSPMGHCTKATDGKAAAFRGTISLRPRRESPASGCLPAWHPRGWESCRKTQLKRDWKLPPPCLRLFYLVTQVFITPFTRTWGVSYPARFFKPVVKVFAQKHWAAAYCKCD